MYAIRVVLTPADPSAPPSDAAVGSLARFVRAASRGPVAHVTARRDGNRLAAMTFTMAADPHHATRLAAEAWRQWLTADELRGWSLLSCQADLLLNQDIGETDHSPFRYP